MVEGGGGGGGGDRKREAKQEKNTWGNHSWQCAGSCTVFCNLNMFLCTSSLGAITAYRLLMSSDFDKLLNMF